MRTRSAVAILCVAALASACATSTERTYDAGSLDAVADGKYEPTLSSDCRDRLGAEPSDGTFLVFFICEDLSRAGPPDIPSAVPRALEPGRDAGEQALEALFDGPTGAETRAGFTSGFGRSTSALRFTYQRTGNTGVVDLSKDFLDVEFLFVPVSHFAEVVSTVGALEGIERVAILVDGEPICKKVDC